ncbi:helix-turn-helix domain-containing protein [Streptacidiphilus sp. N1-3]|uniref:Helix-turn-helix domain-containing protein n=1 Tax=Streptacidiphilus alkalitolerans TaxID=3342712 RepID=A0ABV6X8C3_9ACTN
MAASTPHNPDRQSGKPARNHGGVIAGYVFRLIRELLGFTQDGLAERFHVSADTIAGWETGRRALAAVPLGQMLIHRHRLLHLGVSSTLLAALDRAIEADVLFTAALQEHASAVHPLGAWVLLPAPARARRGPVAAAPELSAADQCLFFARMRATAESARTPEHFLLRRQALYLAGYDRASDTAAWVDHQQATARPEGWLDQWLSARSVASVAARQGDRDRIAAFVRNELLDDDRGEVANLNYWAYWTGEIPGVELDDTFMGIRRPDSWHGRRLLHHVADRLDPAYGYLDLYVHTLWALLAARPQLLHDGSIDRAVLRERVEILLDGPEISTQVDRELSGVRYALRLAGA